MSTAGNAAWRGLAPGTIVFLGMLATCAVGLAVTATGRWQGGVVCLGVALSVGAAARLLLPSSSAGLLRVRRKLADAAALGAAAFVVVFMAVTIAARG